MFVQHLLYVHNVRLNWVNRESRDLRWRCGWLFVYFCRCIARSSLRWHNFLVVFCRREEPRGRYVKTWRRQRRTEPRSSAYGSLQHPTCTSPNYFVGVAQKIGRSSALWFSSYASGQTDKQTDLLITILRTLTGVKW